MKTTIKITLLIFLVILASIGRGQTLIVCGASSTITATNSLNLSNPSYSLNPGGITSLNPTFTVPATSVIYTLYVTGTNSSSVLVTTSSTVMLALNGPTYSLTSPNGFTLGCGSASVCGINIVNANTTPTPGGPVTYTLLAPGSSSILPSGLLSSISVYAVNTPGTWTVVVRDPTNSCSTMSTVSITSNTALPVIGTVSVPQSTLNCTNPSVMLQASPNAAVQYSWLFAGTPGSVQANNIVVNSTSIIPTLTLVNTYTLVATDINNHCKADTVIPIYQNIFPPNAVILTPSLPSCQDTVVLTNASSTGIPGNVPFSTSLSVVVSLWEGPSPQATLGLSSTYTAQTQGTYTMTVTDMNNGCTATATINFIPGPAAAFVHTITGGQATFNDASTGTNSTTTYFWDFGDGNSSTLQNPTHTYTNGGAYFVKFKVTSASCSDSVIQSVNITGISCTANSNFSIAPTGTAQVWNVVPAYPWNVTAASWSWGDGSTSNTLYTAHQYSAAGMYNICLSVTVSCAASSSTCATYSVYRVSQQAMMLEVNVVAPELVTGLSAVAADAPFTWNIVPNPNAGEFNLDLGKAQSETMHVVIQDLTGRVVHDQVAEPVVSISSAGLTPGMYLVTLKVGEQKYTKRMVVSR